MHDPTDTAFQFFSEIDIIANLASNMVKRSLPHGLTFSQFAVLNWFHRVDSEASPGRLARAFQVTPGAMTNTLAKLSHKRFVKIAVTSASARSKVVRITKAGTLARQAAIDDMRPHFEAFLDHFPEQRLTRALPFLEQVREYLDRARD